MTTHTCLPYCPPRPALAADPRAHLCRVATRVFADRGYANASTREICAAAGVNIAAIHYYFGDKAGLYRAVFLQPVQELVGNALTAMRADASLEDALYALYSDFLKLLTSEEGGEQIVRLHAREMLEPSGVVEPDALLSIIVPHHKALVALVCRELGLARPDADVSRIVFAIMGMINIYASDAQILHALAPDLLDGPAAVDTLAQRLTGYGAALVRCEAQRRSVQRLVPRAPRKSARKAGRNS